MAMLANREVKFLFPITPGKAWLLSFFRCEMPCRSCVQYSNFARGLKLLSCTVQGHMCRPSGTYYRLGPGAGVQYWFRAFSHSWQLGPDTSHRNFTHRVRCLLRKQQEPQLSALSIIRARRLLPLLKSGASVCQPQCQKPAVCFVLHLYKETAVFFLTYRI